MQQSHKRLNLFTYMCKLKKIVMGLPWKSFQILIMDADFTKKRKANTKSPFEVLYDDVVDPAASQSSKETSGTFPLLEKKVPFGFS